MTFVKLVEINAKTSFYTRKCGTENLSGYSENEHETLLSDQDRNIASILVPASHQTIRLFFTSLQSAWQSI